MRLINIHTGQMKTFLGSDRPPYAILSHCWGTEEVSFNACTAALNNGGQLPNNKVTQFCAYLRSGSSQSTIPKAITWAWIDTCCIDKESSSELSEAINSMYNWYQDSWESIAYVQDVTAAPCAEGCRSRCQECIATLRQFEESRWFTRGWTLQELIAPQKLIFVNNNWQNFGSGATIVPRIELPMSQIIERVIRVPLILLEDPDQLVDYSMAQRMSWAATRDTTRSEDQAYCLIGLLGVNMSLLYGEGGQAWIRLQHEIARTWNDESIFAWDLDDIDEQPLLTSI
ncbi:hypothetical protein CLAFUW4_05692 [Fulvia fulva]|uniref:Vegetative incompatibility protein HET-E-1 n=1 Tax=Passalora fulva TaxID=5499 RepID=A0A9Q8LIU9_PASFU|nr:Vegetative incompatibility protein HET-E-1 [Fulvia fulva]KAK4624512.1 hypothetical protein CLAFUR4_05686 [Fulvia fulva]KAK4625031.1 hypothetical protein CLAFUR0_05695 [Fulvia fulva]UJO18206.1 Vegetative incompatibility protein HET-E-1 [Fulvia fulva]WPV15452.1 hypothetical protein CLAFUW4_05692 [Fulvia fulva]